MAFKERKLMPKEKEELKKLEKEARDRQIDHVAAIDKLESDKSNTIGAAIRDASTTVKEANEVYQQAKREVDKWKEQELRRVEREYQGKLDEVRLAKSEICQRAEADIETVRADRNYYVENERRRLGEELTEFLLENKMAQENIRFGPPDQRKELKPEIKKEEKKEPATAQPASA